MPRRKDNLLRYAVGTRKKPAETRPEDVCSQQLLTAVTRFASDVENIQYVGDLAAQPEVKSRAAGFRTEELRRCWLQMVQPVDTRERDKMGYWVDLVNFVREQVRPNSPLLIDGDRPARVYPVPELVPQPLPVAPAPPSFAVVPQPQPQQEQGFFSKFLGFFTREKVPEDLRQCSVNSKQSIMETWNREGRSKKLSLDELQPRTGYEVPRPSIPASVVLSPGATPWDMMSFVCTIGPADELNFSIGQAYQIYTARVQMPEVARIASAAVELSTLEDVASAAGADRFSYWVPQVPPTCAEVQREVLTRMQDAFTAHLEAGPRPIDITRFLADNSIDFEGEDTNAIQDEITALLTFINSLNNNEYDIASFMWGPSLAYWQRFLRLFVIFCQRNFPVEVFHEPQDEPEDEYLDAAEESAEESAIRGGIDALQLISQAVDDVDDTARDITTDDDIQMLMKEGSKLLDRVKRLEADVSRIPEMMAATETIREQLQTTTQFALWTALNVAGIQEAITVTQTTLDNVKRDMETVTNAQRELASKTDNLHVQKAEMDLAYTQLATELERQKAVVAQALQDVKSRVPQEQLRQLESEAARLTELMTNTVQITSQPLPTSNAADIARVEARIEHLTMQLSNATETEKSLNALKEDFQKQAAAVALLQKETPHSIQDLVKLSHATQMQQRKAGEEMRMLQTRLDQVLKPLQADQQRKYEEQLRRIAGETIAQYQALASRLDQRQNTGLSENRQEFEKAMRFVSEVGQQRQGVTTQLAAVQAATAANANFMDSMNESVKRLEARLNDLNVARGAEDQQYTNVQAQIAALTASMNQRVDAGMEYVANMLRGKPGFKRLTKMVRGYVKARKRKTKMRANSRARKIRDLTMKLNSLETTMATVVQSGTEMQAAQTELQTTQARLSAEMAELKRSTEDKLKGVEKFMKEGKKQITDAIRTFETRLATSLSLEVALRNDVKQLERDMRTVVRAPEMERQLAEIKESISETDERLSTSIAATTRQVAETERQLETQFLNQLDGLRTELRGTITTSAKEAADAIEGVNSEVKGLEQRSGDTVAHLLKLLHNAETDITRKFTKESKAVELKLKQKIVKLRDALGERLDEAEGRISEAQAFIAAEEARRQEEAQDAAELQQRMDELGQVPSQPLVLPDITFPSLGERPSATGEARPFDINIPNITLPSLGERQSTAAPTPPSIIVNKNAFTSLTRPTAGGAAPPPLRVNQNAFKPLTRPSAGARTPTLVTATNAFTPLVRPTTTASVVDADISKRIAALHESLVSSLPVINKKPVAELAGPRIPPPPPRPVVKTEPARVVPQPVPPPVVPVQPAPQPPSIVQPVPQPPSPRVKEVPVPQPSPRVKEQPVPQPSPRVKEQPVPQLPPYMQQAYMPYYVPHAGYVYPGMPIYPPMPRPARRSRTTAKAKASAKININIHPPRSRTASRKKKPASAPKRAKATKKKVSTTKRKYKR